MEEVLRALGKSDSSWGTHEGVGWTVAATVGESWLVVVVRGRPVWESMTQWWELSTSSL